MVRAKFHVTEITEHSNGFIVKLYAVTDGSPENDEFFKWTPGGDITLQTLNENAAREFKVGQEYYVDFTIAELEKA